MGDALSDSSFGSGVFEKNGRVFLHSYTLAMDVCTRTDRERAVLYFYLLALARDPDFDTLNTGLRDYSKSCPTTPSRTTGVEDLV